MILMDSRSSEFVGYNQLEVESDVTAMTSETEVVDALTDGDKGTIIVAKTPFYATMGGQEADKGIICTEDGEFVVEDVVKLAGGKFGHVGRIFCKCRQTSFRLYTFLCHDGRRTAEG